MRIFTYIFSFNFQSKQCLSLQDKPISRLMHLMVMTSQPQNNCHLYAIVQWQCNGAHMIVFAMCYTLFVVAFYMRTVCFYLFFQTDLDEYVIVCLLLLWLPYWFAFDAYFNVYLCERCLRVSWQGEMTSSNSRGLWLKPQTNVEMCAREWYNNSMSKILQEYISLEESASVS